MRTKKLIERVKRVIEIRHPKGDNVSC